jgi:glycosyltransferase involved in cell wall biosynthesis
MPLISIITACYNQGNFLKEAFTSIELEKHKNIFEHIVINDGSTDEETIKICNELESQGVKVIHQQNKGLGAARNAGIKISTGKYILPLDSDNKIDPEIMIEAAQKMEQNEKINVVYTDAKYFGARNNDWIVGEFSIPKMLFCNFIDACALIRKSILDEDNCYDGDMPAMGHEDWELWVRISLTKNGFYYFRRFGFYYRVREDSMSATISNPNFIWNRQYIYNKHATLIAEFMRSLGQEKGIKRFITRSKNFARRIIKN